MKLSTQERETLDRVLESLRKQGIKVSDEKVLAALLKAAVQLPEERLLQLLKASLEDEAAKRKTDCQRG